MFVQNKRGSLFLLFILLVSQGFFLPGKAQTPVTQAREELKHHGAVYLVVPFENRQQLKSLARYGVIDAVSGDSVRINMKPEQFEEFSGKGWPFRVYTLYRPTSGKAATLEWQGWNSYPSYTQYDSVMRSFADSFPGLCRLDTIGTTPQNHQILVVKISDSVHFDQPEPEFLYSATIHGDETGGYILMLRLIDYLLSRYGSDTLVTRLVDNLEILICPLANPDGTYRGGDESIAGAWRYNAAGIDLNRNFPDPQDGDHPDSQEHQPETKAMMDFHQRHHIGFSANFHAGAEVVNYPWDTWSRLHADDAWFKRVSRIYADTVHQYAPAGYMSGFDNGITNGAEWYSISGGRQDYVTYFEHGRESTIELDNDKVTPESLLDTLWAYNYRSLLYYMREAMFGVSGFVTDSVTGKPVSAEIFIPGHDFDSSQVFSDSASGYYHRYLAAGNYSFSVRADGYTPKQISGIVVNNGQQTRMDVQLVPLSSSKRNNGSHQPLIFPNPVRRGEILKIFNAQVSGHPVLYSVDGKSHELKWSYSETGRNGFRIPADLPPGVYILGIQNASSPLYRKIIILEE